MPRTPSETERLFVFTAQAVSVGTADRPAGQRHAHLIFVRAADLAQAQASAVERVEAEGGIAVTLMRSKDLPDGATSIADGVLRAAAEAALRDGCGFVVYADPLPHDA